MLAGPCAAVETQKPVIFPVPINTFKSLDFHIVYNSLSLYLSGITISNCAKPLFF